MPFIASVIALNQKISTLFFGKNQKHISFKEKT